MDAVEAYRYGQLLGAIHDLKREFHAKINTLIEGQHHIMALIDMEDAEITAIEATLAPLGAGISQVVSEAEASGNQFTPSHIARLTAIANALQGDVAQLPTVTPTVQNATGVGALPGTAPIPTPVDPTPTPAADPTTPVETPVDAPVVPPVVSEPPLDSTPPTPTPDPVVASPVSDPLPDAPVTPLDVASPAVAPTPTTDTDGTGTPGMEPVV